MPASRSIWNLILIQVLRITLESMTSQIGTVHFLDEEECQFNLAAQIGLVDELRPYLEKIDARERFWNRLLESSSPLVIPDTTQEFTRSGSEATPVELPAEFAILAKAGQRAFIGAPIRAKGQVLGCSACSTARSWITRSRISPCL